MIRYGKNSQAVIDAAAEAASHLGGIIYTEHLLYALLCVGGTVARQILNMSGVYAEDVAREFAFGAPCSEVSVSDRAGDAIALARQVATDFASDVVNTEHLLFATLNDPMSGACDILLRRGIDPEHVQRLAYNAIVERGGSRPDYCVADGSVQGINEVLNGYARPMDDSKTSRRAEALPESGDLSKFGTDLTLKARQGKLDPVIGRDSETKRVIQVLCRRIKNNPVLVGEPGVGKSAIIDGLALAIAEGNVPEPLKGKTVFSLDLSALVAGTRYRGDFEERLKTTLNLIKQRGDIILFIDEIHTILKAGASEGGLDIANILKPMLARGELTTIGATTIEEYRKQFEQDSALERRFQPVAVDEPSVSDTVEILSGLRSKYEAHHGVAISDEAIAAAAVLSDRYIRDRFLPDKAVDLMDEAAACKRLAVKELPEDIKAVQSQLAEAKKALKELDASGNEFREKRIKQLVEALSKDLSEACAAHGDAFTVTEDDIAAVVSEQTGIPVDKMSEEENKKLSSLEDVLKSKVIRQDRACEAVARAVRRARAGIKDPRRPIGSFLFLGPTGVGKTELAKSLAEALFGDPQMLIRIDMSEYMDKGSVSRLIGAAPGLVGFEEGGQLTEKIRRKPYSVVLFDEIEKGHEDIYNLLLQVLEDGILTDSKGKTVSFKNAVIILTSNVGAREAAESSRVTGFGAQSSAGDEREKYMQALRAYMKPEIINRLDEIVVFEKLDESGVKRILDIMLSSLSKRMGEKGIKLKCTDAAKRKLIAEGYDPAYGARPLRRALQRFVEDRLSELVLDGELNDGDIAFVDSDGVNITVEKL